MKVFCPNCGLFTSHGLGEVVVPKFDKFKWKEDDVSVPEIDERRCVVEHDADIEEQIAAEDAG